MASGRYGCLAFLAAAIGAAVAGGLWMGADLPFLPVFIFGFFVAAAHIALPAMPVYFWLDRRYRPTLPRIILASALVGALPISVVALADGGTENVGDAAAFGLLCGIAGGVPFWLVLKLAALWPRGRVQ
jgi:hypothetical protein